MIRHNIMLSDGLGKASLLKHPFAPPIDKTKGTGAKVYRGARNNEIIKGRRRKWPS